MDSEIVEQYRLQYFQNGIDVPFKLKSGATINIKPIKVIDWYTFEPSSEILKLDKNSVNDPQIISMSYLQYITDVIFLVYEPTKDMLYNVLHLSLGYENFVASKDKKGKSIIKILSDDSQDVIGIINAKEFNDIKDIILHYNFYDYDDRYIDSDVKQLMEDYQRMNNKGEYSSPNLEQVKSYVMSKTSYKLNEINEMLYRQFDLIFQSCLNSENYIADKIIQGSYKYDSTNVIHPLFRKKEDPFAQIFEDVSVLSSKGISNAESLNSLNYE